MTGTTIKEIAFAILFASFGVGALPAQPVARSESPGPVVAHQDMGAPDAREIIFSNVGPSSQGKYNPDTNSAFNVTGRTAGDEIWIGIWFIPKVDVRAKELLAAIGYLSGTKLVNLGLYSHNPDTGSVGTPLPGGQGSITDIPDAGTCCQMVRVTLPGEGVLLTGGTTYWLVAGPDNVNAPTFSGTWQLSYRAVSASLVPPLPWLNYPGQWAAAQIRGRRVDGLGPAKAPTLEVPSPDPSAPAADVTIFRNLGPTSTNLYNSFNGFPVRGNNVPDDSEVWTALPFTPKANSHARTLAAAIGYLSGTRKVNLGIYSDSGGTVGTLLPGGQGSTTEIPDASTCCELTKVRLPGAGVALSGGTQYWLVASPDNVNAPDFSGLWYDSNLAVSAYQEPEQWINWTSFTGDWRAAEIRGTTP